MRNLLNYFYIVIIVVVIGCSGKDPAPSVVIIPASFLKGDTYDKLEVEIQYMDGFQPNSTTISNLQTFLAARLNKPAGITFVQKAISAQGKAIYTLTDIEDIENANRTEKTSGKTLKAYMLFVDGGYTDDTANTKVLGVTYAPSSIVVFEKTVKDFTGGVNKPSISVLESTVLEHEFGHVMGLVNRGTTMQTPHEDTAHAKHCTDTSCLMYYLAETSGMAGNLMGGSIPSLTGSCLADLQAAGGK